MKGRKTGVKIPGFSPRLASLRPNQASRCRRLGRTRSFATVNGERKKNREVHSGANGGSCRQSFSRNQVDARHAQQSNVLNSFLPLASSFCSLREVSGKGRSVIDGNSVSAKTGRQAAVHMRKGSMEARDGNRDPRDGRRDGFGGSFRQELRTLHSSEFPRAADNG